MTPAEVIALVGGWAAIAVPVALVWGRGRCRHPQPRPVGTALAVPDRDEELAPGGPVVVVVRHDHTVTVRHVHHHARLEAGRPPVVVDGEILPLDGRGWAR
ncbi:hypothetical protein ACFQE5_22450 [Pseudonocardia hispaniensis]|uniref:Uncharacterized protein n=1 Tax=Pseudonocardia hispaniensis TaxID=904933 RepID=A0ABW1J888_9PSEU